MSAILSSSAMIIDAQSNTIPMTELFTALINPDLGFLRYAFLTGILASVAFGVIGTYIVVRRITSIAGAISHCVLGGIGIGLYCEQALGTTWLGPTSGAIIIAVLAAVILTYVSMYSGQREDTVIGALWGIGMAVGLLFIAKTPGYSDPMSYLFGNILLLTQADLYLVIVLDILIVSLVMFFYNHFLVLCFDEEYGRLRGIHTGALYLLLLLLTSLTIVLLIRVVGIVMVIALLTLPAAIAGNFVKSIGQMMVVSVILCMIFISSGLSVSYTLDLPSGPVIIVIAGIVYLSALLWRRFVASSN